MKRKCKMFIIVFLALSCALCLFFGCKGIENIGNGDSYQWVYEADMSKPCDENMKIDGILDEESWKGKKEYIHTQNGVKLSVSTIFSQKGLYIGATAHDKNLIWVKRMNFNKNSCFWFSIKGKDTTYEVGTDVFNVYVDGKNAWNFNGIHFQGKGLTDKDYDDSPTSLACEVFIAWEDLNIELGENGELPECVRINPQYLSYDGIGTYNWITGMFFFSDRDRMECSGRFGAEGYINADTDDAVIGNAKNGYAKSDGWDITKLEEGVVKSDVDHSQGIFFKEIYSTAYWYTVSVTIGEDIYNKSPSGAGVMDAVSQIECSAFYLNAVSARNQARAEYSTLGFYKEGAYAWVYKGEGFVTPDYASAGGKVVYTVVKDGGNYYYIVNGQFVMSKYIGYLQGATCPGFYTLDTAATFTDFEAHDLSSDASQVDEILESYNVYRVKLDEREGSAGGTVEFSSSAVEAGGSVTMTVKTANRYLMTGFEMGDGEGTMRDCYDEVTAGMKDGKYTIENITETKIVKPVFTKISNVVKVSGKLTSEEDKWLSGLTVTLKGSGNVLYYSTVSASNGDYTFYVPEKGSMNLNGKEFVFDGKYRLGIKGSGYLPLYDSLTIDKEAIVKNYTVKAPEYGKESYGIIEDGESYFAADKLTGRTSAYKFFDTRDATVAVLQAKVTVPDNAALPSNFGVGLTLTDGTVLAEDKVDTMDKVRKAGNYKSKEIGLSNLGLFCSSYLIGCKSRYPGVWGGGTFSELQYTSNGDSLWSGTTERTLTVVLYNDVLYIWIDDTYILELSTTDTSYFDTDFTRSDGYRFGVFFLDTAGIDMRVEVDETYGDVAAQLISDTPIYREKIFPSVPESENIHAENGEYVVDSLSFRKSGYAYTSPETYSDTVVYSVKVRVDNLIDEATVDGIGDWPTIIGITLTNGTVVETEKIDNLASSLNKYYAVQIGLNKYGLISGIGGTLSKTSRLDTPSVFDEKTVIDGHNLTAGAEKTLTVVLYDFTLYIYIDGTFVVSKSMSYDRFSAGSYAFSPEDTFKFGVNVSNLDTAKNKATVRVVSELYGEAALEEIKKSYANEIVANGFGVVRQDGVYKVTNAGAEKIDGVWQSHVAYVYNSYENYRTSAVFSVKIDVGMNNGTTQLTGQNGAPMVGIIIGNKDGKSVVIALDNYGVVCMRTSSAYPTYASELGRKRRVDGTDIWALDKSENAACSFGENVSERTLTVAADNDELSVYVDGSLIRKISFADKTYFDWFAEGDSYQFGLMATNIDMIASSVSMTVLTEKYGREAKEEVEKGISSSAVTHASDNIPALVNVTPFIEKRGVRL